MPEEIIKTDIEGLQIKLNKVVGDMRGVLCEMAPGGFVHEFFKAGVRNVYSSIATGKHTARAGHFHYKNIENFYTLSGTALWVFKDMRESSQTFGKIFGVVVGYDKPENANGVSSYTIDESKFAQMFVPAGVYHIYWPLSEEKVTIVAVASAPYEKEDYVYPDVKKMEDVKNFVSKFGIRVE